MPRPARPVTAEIKQPGKRGVKGVASRIRQLKVQNPQMGATTIARVVGCNPSNVTRILQRFLGNSSETDLQDYQNQKANIFDALQKRIHESISDKDIAKAQLLPRVTAAAILEDKARVIRGQATNINVSLLVDAVQAVREMRKQHNTSDE